MFKFLKKLFGVSKEEKIENYEDEKTQKHIINEETLEEIRKKAAFDEMRKCEESEFVSSVDPSKYLVIDVETNGFSAQRDDLLSIAIYRPDTNQLYHRYLPLELNDKVLTSHINRITDEMLSNVKALSQSDVDEIINDYDVENRTVLTYGNLDERFIRYYFARHKLRGFEKFHFYNFKRDVISSRFSEGNATKDNLCKLFFIENVNEIHTADNDCILEWKLYQRMNGGLLFITDNKVFEFNTDEYIIPVSFLQSHPNFKYHLPPMPRVLSEAKVVYRSSITGGYLKKFGTNFNGVIIENLINKMLQVKVINSKTFLLENKSKLKYIGLLESKVDIVPVRFNLDGTIKTMRSQDIKIENEMNNFILSLKKDMNQVVDFIKKDIFENADIMSQELVVNKEANILALCDLSSESAVLEIKATNYREVNSYGTQMYYESRGRDTYLLQVDWNNLPNRLDIIISKISFKLYEPKQNTYESRFKIAKELIENEEIQLINYVNKSSKVLLKCKKCGNEWECSYNMALKKRPCAVCNPPQKKATRLRPVIIEEKKVIRRRPVMTEEEKKEKRANAFYEKVKERSCGNIVAYNYVGSKERVSAKCLVCGFEWNARADHLLDRCYCINCKMKK